MATTFAWTSPDADELKAFPEIPHCPVFTEKFEDGYGPDGKPRWNYQEPWGQVRSYAHWYHRDRAGRVVLLMRHGGIAGRPGPHTVELSECLDAPVSAEPGETWGELREEPDRTLTRLTWQHLIRCWRFDNVTACQNFYATARADMDAFLNRLVLEVL